MPPQRTDTLQKVELADGVEIRLPIAGPLPRALAVLLDSIIQAVAGIVVVLVLGATEGLVGGEFAIGVLLLLSLIHI